MSTDANRSIVGSSRWVWLVALSVVAVSVAVIAGVGEFDFGASPADNVGTVGFLLVGPMFAITAALILTKLPRNTIGG